MNKASDKDYISATEISEYVFCSVAWYMDKEGYPRSKETSKRFKRGTRRHRFLLAKYGFIKAAIVSLVIIVAVAIIVLVGLIH